MLETTDLTIEAIADEAGYEETSFFCRLFGARLARSLDELRFSATEDL